MYSVNYANRVESNTVKECVTLDEAKAFCKEFFEGYEPFDGDDDDKISWCKCEVFEILGDGNLNEVYCTDLFWEKQ